MHSLACQFLLPVGVDRGVVVVTEAGLVVLVVAGIIHDGDKQSFRVGLRTIRIVLCLQGVMHGESIPVIQR